MPPLLVWLQLLLAPPLLADAAVVLSRAQTERLFQRRGAGAGAGAGGGAAGGAPPAPQPQDLAAALLATCESCLAACSAADAFAWAPADLSLAGGHAGHAGRCHYVGGGGGGSGGGGAAVAVKLQPEAQRWLELARTDPSALVRGGEPCPAAVEEREL